MFAWLVRIIGIEWGGQNSEEYIDSAVKALAGQLVPPQHFYPPLSNYLNAITFIVMYVLARLGGFFSSTAELRQLYVDNPMPFYYAARLFTAFLGALTAPLATLIALKYGLTRRSSFLVGLIMALLPVSILWSHVSKPQIGMTTGLIFLILAVVHLLYQPCSTAHAALVGVAAAIAGAYKHSAIFLIAPLLVGLLALEIRDPRVHRKLTISHTVVTISVGLLVWSVLSIGILLDLPNFLEYQTIQAQMSYGPNGIAAFFQTSLPTLISFCGGATPLLFLGFFVVPFVFRDNHTLLFWCSTIVGLVLVIIFARGQTSSGFFLPFTSYIVLFTAIFFGRLADSYEPHRRRLGRICLVGSLLCVLFGTTWVLRQAITYPVKKELARVIQGHAAPETTRILAADIDKIDLTQSFEARKAEQARHTRLAKKYNISLDTAGSKHHTAPPNQRLTYYIIPIPWITSGLEYVEEKDIAVIKPFIWPRQREEWTLDYWLKDNFRLFVVRKEWWMTTKAHPTVVTFHKAIIDRCELLHIAPSRRPLFWEEEYRVYDCEKARVQIAPSPLERTAPELEQKPAELQNPLVGDELIQPDS
ncbi:MAG: phospholipid carrier-dependent glycosyltransferase [Myxococcales bacterium]|nr:phospholipid carrier-dependent glycosyltransferase [Myxococcales bacterium]